MSQLISKINYILISLLLFSCTLNSVDDNHKKYPENKEYNTDVAINLPRVNPFIEEKLFGNSRAYAVADKVKVVVKKGTEVVKEGEYILNAKYRDENSEIIDFRITLSLPVGAGYKMYIDSFNLNNSSTVPTVKGVSTEFSITEDVITNLSVSMIPYMPQDLEVGIEKSVSSMVHSVRRIQGENTVGSEHWFKFKAASNYSSIERELLSISYGGYSFDIPSSSMFIFDSNGNFIEAQDEKNGVTIFKTVANQFYYICMIPLAVDTGESLFKKDTIKVLVKNYVDSNSSTASAVNVDLGITSNFYTGANDEDFYKIYLDSGKYVIESSNYEVMFSGGEMQVHGMTIDILSSDATSIASFPKNVDGIFEITTPDYYYIKASSLNSMSDTFDWYQFEVSSLTADGAIIANGIWKDYSFTDQYKNYYYGIDIDQLKDYVISSKTSDNDSSYNGDGSLSLFYLNYNSSLNIWEMKYLNHHLSDSSDFINYPQGVYKVYLKLRVYSKGTIGLKLDKVEPVIINGSLGSGIESESANGMVKYYSIPVTGGATLSFNSFSGSNSDTAISSYFPGEAYFSVFSEDRSKIYYNNSSLVESGTFPVEAGVNSIIVKVLHRYSYGKVGFLLDEVVTTP